MGFSNHIIIIHSDMVRDSHLTDPETSRDLFGIVRGSCSCDACGRYIIYTSKYRGASGNDEAVHPDCNLSLLDCSRCGCPGEAHAVDVAGTARERGNDALSLGEYDGAVAQYTEAILHDGLDWRNYTNRSLCYEKKGWYEQAASDADRAVSLNPGYYKCHYRQGRALCGLGRYEGALEACGRAMACLVGKGEGENERAVRALEWEVRGRMRKAGGQAGGKAGGQAGGKAREDVAGEGKDVAGEAAGVRLTGIGETLRRLEEAVGLVLRVQQAQDERMGRIEEALQRILGKRSEEQGRSEGRERVGDDSSSDCSEASSDMSDFDAIADIQKAWKERLECTEQEESPERKESGCVSRKSTATLQDEERQRRVEAAQERSRRAEESGEVLMSTDLDMLLQQRRMECTSCASCPGFRIVYSTTDVHDTDIMFYCSLCGCSSEYHRVDEAYAREQAAAQAADEREAKERAARARNRGGTSRGSSKRKEALRVLGLHHAATEAEIQKAFRRLAKQLHPDKATGIGSTGHEFVRIREARDLLLQL